MLAQSFFFIHSLPVLVVPLNVFTPNSFPPQVLTIFYHMTLRKINVSRGEFSPAISVLCFASFCSMCMLLYEIHLCPASYKRHLRD